MLRGILQGYDNTKPIAINEETSEIYVSGKNVIQREVLKSRDENKQITLDTLLRQSLVLSTEIIVIGEIKGKEASVFMDAILTGHTGISTVHANNAETVFDRLTLLVKKEKSSSDYKEEHIKAMLAKSIEYIIHMQDYKIIQIVKVEYLSSKNQIKYKNIYNIRK